MTRILVALLMIAFYGHLLFGCAHVAPAVATVKGCAPPTADFAALVLQVVDGAATVDNALTEAEVLAGQTAVCTVTQIAQDVLQAATGIQLATTAPPSMRQQWASAWLASHSKGTP